MGRLTRNILLSFAEFERALICERTRDKIAAAKRKGKYAGGAPILGYDVARSPSGSKLVINPDEALRVRQIFELYLEKGSLIATVQELALRGWTNKRRQSRDGDVRGGQPFNKCSLWNLLTRITYAGKVSYRGEAYNGEHEAIVPGELWQKVQDQLRSHGRSGGTEVRNKHGALLKGIVRCAACGCAMSHTYTAKVNRRYRYYTCLNAQKRGWQACPTKSVPAAEVERFVIEQIRCIGRDPALIEQTVRKAQEHGDKASSELNAERTALTRHLRRLSERVNRAASNGGETAAQALADLQEQTAAAERRAAEIEGQLRSLGNRVVRPEEVAAALQEFDGAWSSLSPREQARLLHLLVERVECDGRDGMVTLRFHPSGIRTLLQHHSPEKNA